MIRSLTRPLVLALASAPAVAQVDVWTVDAAGGLGADFTTIEAAVAAAGDGDILVFRPGFYPGPFLPFVKVDGKGLTLVAEGAVEITTLEVENLAPDQAFTMRGFLGSAGGLDLKDCDGPVWLEDLRIHPGATDPLHHFDVNALRCAAVSLNRCGLLGLPASTLFNEPALRVAESAAHLYDCVLTGGAGFVHPPTLTPGDPGLAIVSGFAFAQGSSFVPGILAEEAATQSGPTSSSLVLDCTGDFTVLEGSHVALPGAKRSFEATAIAREGESVTMTWAGAPGEIAVMNLSLSAGGFYLPQYHGSGVIGLPLFLVQGVGAIPASGETSVQVPIPELGAGVEGLVVYAQGSFADLSAGAIRLGGGSAIVLLDQAL
jgi:hypothetical protein